MPPFGETGVPNEAPQPLPLGPLPNTRYPDSHIESLDKRFKGSPGTGGVERVADSFLVVRIGLDSSGTRAEPRAILAASTQPTVGTLTPEGFYYLAAPGPIRLVKVR